MPLDAREKLGEPLIFGIALGDIAGEGTPDRQHQRDIGQQLENREPGKSTNEIEHNAQNQQKPAQMIHAVSPGHKANQRGAKTL